MVVHISLHTIHELGAGTEKILGSKQFMRWWYQDMGREVE